jgi:hypothetical protein
MNTIDFKHLDSLIESALTNIAASPAIVNTKNDFSQQMDNSITQPMNDYLDDLKKEKEERLKFNTQLKSIQQDPKKRVIADKNIQNDKLGLTQLDKLRQDLKNKTEELKQQQLQQQTKMQMSMKNTMPDNDTNKSNFSSVIKKTIQETLNEPVALPIIKRKFSTLKETAPQAPAPVAASNNLYQQPAPVQKKKIIKVNFDTKTQSPFQAEFTERGFLIGSTRLSFEVIETALSKNFNITLDAGKGLVLDAIKMQKILKYKDKV